MDCIKKIQSGTIFQNEIEPNDWLVNFKSDTLTLFNCLNDIYLDSLQSDNLTQAIYFVKGISNNSPNQKIKKGAVKFLLKVSKSKYSGVSILSSKTLKAFPISCFDNSDIDSIAVLIERYPTVYKEIIELAGYLGNQSLHTKIKEVYQQNRNYTKPERWASYKVLARFGDKEALDYCINHVSKLPLNNQVIEALYPDLIYIHRKEAFDVLIKALNSNENLCSSNNPNSESKILCGYRIMELLALEIEYFPIKVLPSGDLDSKDYNKSLKKVRAWFAKNGNSYTIINKY